LLSIGLSSIFR